MRLTALLKRAQGKIGGPQVARGASVPAPIEGWDAISPIAAMSPKRAVRMDNWFPQPDWVELRRGFILHVTTLESDPIETLAAYNGISSDKLFAAVADKIIDVTDSSGAPASVSGLTNARWQHVNFATTGGNFLYMVNGADSPQYFDGSVWATPTITGITAEDAIGINIHKNRLWFVLNESSDAAYLDVDSIQGVATVFPQGGNWSLGGFLMAIVSWSLDAGNGPDDYIGFVSSKGQVSIYKGIDPDTDFELVGTYLIGAPIGRRCFFKVGADVAIISIDGVVPLSKALIYERAAVQKVTMTQRIQRVMNASARDFKNNFGWQLISYPRGTRAILNVPMSENTEQVQYVMNTLHGAWCQFTGMNANCWEVFQERLYFGGNDGVVYEADTSGADNGAILEADMMTAFNYYGSRGNQKRWMQCRPQLTTDGQVTPGLAFNVDFQDSAPISVPSTPAISAALWDVARWDSANWFGFNPVSSNWTSIAGIGYCASIRLAVNILPVAQGLPAVWGIGLWGENAWGDAVADEITLQVNAFDVTMEQGAIV